MEKIVVINDFANTNAACSNANIKLEAAQLLDYVVADRFLIEGHSFVPIDPRNPQAMDAIIEEQWKAGFIVHSKIGAFAGNSYKCDYDVEITLALMRIAEQVKPDIIVLLSGDKDFIPVILELRQRGIRVEVGSFPGVSAAREVMLKASGFIDLHECVNEISHQNDFDQEAIPLEYTDMYQGDDIEAEEVLTEEE